MAREELWHEIYEERLIGYLDPGAERYLERFNATPRAWTTSSCLGRITVVEARYHWLRRGARVVYKTHDPITPGELEKVMSRGFQDLWLKVTGPIVHFKVETQSCAFSILRAARASGFKHSGIISGGSELTVEVMSSASFQAPLRLGGIDLYRGQALGLLADLANETLLEGRSRLDRLATLFNEDQLKECF